MIRNYLTIAYRNILRNKGYALINIGGLAVGLACCILAVVYVRYEFSFDRFHEKAERTYRIVETRSMPEGDKRVAQTVGPMGPSLVRDIPAVEHSVRLMEFFRMTVERGDARYYVGDYYFTEPSFFDVFGFELLRGNPATALTRPQTVVLTEKSARTYFGSENPLGKTLSIEWMGEVTVTGVLETPPDRSHLTFSMLFPFAQLAANTGFWSDYTANWQPDFRAMLTYVVLAEDVEPDDLQANVSSLLGRHREADMDPASVSLQPLTDIHFHSATIEADANQNEGSLAYIYIFSAIALFLILIAAINYMNLATARSTERAREVGLRKTAGAHRSQLIGQFLSESVLLTSLAAVIGAGLAYLTLPIFADLAGRQLSFHLLNDASTILLMFGAVIVVGLVAGSFPALYLTRFQTARILRGINPGEGRGLGLRRTLVVVQFTLSIILIVGTLVVYQQLQYMQDKRLGFQKEEMVVIDINSQDVREQFESVKDEFARHYSVQHVTVSSSVPGDWKSIPTVEAAPEGMQETRTAYLFGVDDQFLDAYDVHLVEGRAFTDERAADSSAVLINQAAARAYGWDEPLGKTIGLPAQEFSLRVIGVVEDFHFQSLHDPIRPLMITRAPGPVTTIDYFTARISSTDVPAALAHLRTVGERFDTAHPFEYHFLEEQIGTFYATEARVARLFGIFAGLAILIACLGLFGLASYTASRRTKEIGVRKVLGASVASILALLTRDFLLLVGLSFVIAAPVAYFAMQQWLEDFAYHVELGAGIIAVTGALALFIAVMTVSYHAMRAALTDPVKALR